MEIDFKRVIQIQAQVSKDILFLQAQAAGASDNLKQDLQTLIDTKQAIVMNLESQMEAIKFTLPAGAESYLAGTVA